MLLLQMPIVKGEEKPNILLGRKKDPSNIYSCHCTDGKYSLTISSSHSSIGKSTRQRWIRLVLLSRIEQIDGYNKRSLMRFIQGAKNRLFFKSQTKPIIQSQKSQDMNACQKSKAYAMFLNDANHLLSILQPLLLGIFLGIQSACCLFLKTLQAVERHSQKKMLLRVCISQIEGNPISSKFPVVLRFFGRLLCCVG